MDGEETENPIMEDVSQKLKEAEITEQDLFLQTRNPRLHQHTIGMPRLRSGRRHRNRNQNRSRRQNVEVSPDSEVSDDDKVFTLNDVTRNQVLLPRRSVIHAKLEVSLKDDLKANLVASITLRVARSCLGKARFNLMKQTNRIGDKLTLTDSHGWMHLFWLTRNIPQKYLSDSDRVFVAAGFIRDQFDHPLCWDFSLCDMMSATAVLRGQMDTYRPLSHMFIFQNTDTETYFQNVNGNNDHWCYPCEFYKALKFVKQSAGIPVANDYELGIRAEPQGDFDCKSNRLLLPDENIYGITDAFKYQTLPEALIRLRTHPVAATLTCFENWEDSGIYRGPRGNSAYLGEHEVLMLDCIKSEGEMVIRCKASNGEQTANGGYVYVSTEVMGMVVGGARKKNGAFSCLKKPQYLLYDFYSLEMAKGSYPAQIEDDDRKNRKYRIDFDKKGAKSKSPRGMSGSGKMRELLSKSKNEEGDMNPHSSVSPFRYASAIERNPEDHDALYNMALILQESADTVSPDSVSPSKDDLLEEACKKYDEATRLCPTLYDAYYNWAIAISDRAKMRGCTKEAEELWEQATNNYDKAVQLNWKSSQALNNWGLALQELSQIVPATEKEKVVRTAISKFRAAIRLQFDFHGAIFNLGTVLYGLAEDTLSTGGSGNGKDMPLGELYSQSAIYIAAAHSLKPSYSVYSSVLRLVRSMLPLPHLKVGYLTAPPVGNSLAPHSDWKRTEFELNHERLLEVLKPEPRETGRNLSGKSETMNTNVEKKTVKVNITEIVSVTPCADLSLPPGAGLCIDTIHGPVFLVADSCESLDGWLDAIRLVYTIYARGKIDVLAGIITA